jgi:hypothetical protein
LSGTHVAAEALLALVLFSLANSPFAFNGFLSRKAQWIASSIGYSLDERERRSKARSTAATFVVAYMQGVPIETMAVDPRDQVSSSTKSFFAIFPNQYTCLLIRLYLHPPSLHVLVSTLNRRSHTTTPPA